MTMKEKAESILGGFLERNKDYAIELYISNAVTSSRIGKLFIVADRIYKADDEKFTLEWNKDDSYNVNYNKFLFPYDEIMACYEEVEKDNNLKISETVIVILKNGMEFDFGCFGIRI